MEKYQTLWRRIVAFLIDDFIMIPLFVVEQLCEQGGVGRVFFDFWIPLSVLVPLIYKIMMHARGGQTLGKMALGIRVVDGKTKDGISLSQSIRRSMPDVILGVTGGIINIIFFGATDDDPILKSIVPIYVAIRIGWFFADSFMMLNNPERRSLHDLIAGTVVVREEKTTLLIEN